MAPLVQAFQAARVPLAAVDLPELSQRNLAALFEEGGRGLATLIFDDDEGLLTFTTVNCSSCATWKFRQAS